ARGRGGGGYLGDPRSPRLFGRFPGGGAPPGDAPLVAPDRHTAFGRPRDDPVDAYLGHLLHGQFAAVALRDRLDDGDHRLGARHHPPVLDREAQAVPAGRGSGDHALGDQPGAVTDVDPLPRAQPADDRRVPSLRAGQHDLVTVCHAVASEEQRCHDNPQRPLNASRNREKKPCWPGANLPGADSSPRSLDSSRSSLSCSVSSLVGVSTVTWMTRSPRPFPFRCLTPCPYSGMTCPDWVPGRMSMSAGPSSESTDSVAPNAAATIGIVTVQCRSSPCRSEIACCRWTTSRNRSPGGPPPRPTSPSPASWMCVPSSTPAGMRTLIVRRVRTRPSPSHSGHGRGMTVPKPPQPGHTLVVMTCPRNERVTWLTSPRPLQMSQVCGWVPGAVPSPEHVGQTTAVSTVSSRVAPKAHSDRSSSIRIVALRPRCARLRGPRVAAPPMPPPNTASIRSLNWNPAAPNGLPAAPPMPPAVANGSIP